MRSVAPLARLGLRPRLQPGGCILPHAPAGGYLGNEECSLPCLQALMCVEIAGRAGRAFRPPARVAQALEALRLKGARPREGREELGPVWAGWWFRNCHG